MKLPNATASFYSLSPEWFGPQILVTNYAVSKMSGVNRASLDIVIGTLRSEDSDGSENDAEK